MKSVLVRVFPLQGSAADLLDVLQERFSLVAGSVQREGNVLVVGGFLSFGAAFLFIPVPFIVYALSRRSVLPVIARVLGL